MADKRKVPGGKRLPGRLRGNLPRMVNASRAFRNLPPELTLGKEREDDKGEHS